MTAEDAFELKVNQQIERLQSRSFGVIEAEVAQKRIDWVAQNRMIVPPRPALSPRQAFELLFFTYMGLATQDLPVVAETDQQISWLSSNPCPTLEACLRLGLDTRQVCRSAYEKSTQAFLSQLDPQLRFYRSYQEIRPYAPYCRETIQLVDFSAMMAQAVAEAKISRQQGNKGYGAVLALGENIRIKSHDTAVSGHGPELHAELNAVRRAVRLTGDANLSGGILFSTCEPCPMCSSLAVWANLTTLVYGVSIQETASLGKARIRVSAQQIVEASPVHIDVIGGVLKEECRALYQEPPNY
ncbi:MAG: nucleoside deaminase [Anaerolineaceae bacterium]|nr:nucleoside deaminase [Anaerolineaceae bacterium]